MERYFATIPEDGEIQTVAYHQHTTRFLTLNLFKTECLKSGDWSGGWVPKSFNYKIGVMQRGYVFFRVKKFIQNNNPTSSGIQKCKQVEILQSRHLCIFKFFRCFLLVNLIRSFERSAAHISNLFTTSVILFTKHFVDDFESASLWEEC